MSGAAAEAPRPGRDTLWSAIGHFLVYAQSIVLLPLVIKVAGVATYGTYNIVLSMMTILFGISSFGVGYRARRGLASAPSGSTRGELYAPQLVFQFISLTVLALLFGAAKPWIDRTLLSGGDHYSFFAATLYMFGFAVFFQGGDYFRYGKSVNVYTAMTGIAPLLNVAAVVACWAAGLAITSDMLLTVQGLVYLGCGLVVGAMAAIDSGPVRLRLSPTALLSDMRVGYPLILNLLTDILLAASDRYLIAFFLGVVAVGSYQPAYQLGALIIVLGRISGVVLPKFLALHVDAGRHEAARGLLEQAFRIQLLVGIPFVVGSAIMAKPILTVLATPQVAAQSALAVPFIAAGCLLYTLQTSYTQAAYVSGATQIIFRTNLAAAVLKFLTTLLVLVLVRQLWLCGVTTLVAYALAFAYSVMLLRKTWLFRLEKKVVAQSLAAAAVMACALYGLEEVLGPQALRLSGMLEGVGGGMVIYFAALALMGGLGARFTPLRR